METLIRDSLVDLKGFSAHSLVSDGHFFDEVDSDDKIKNYLESTKVNVAHSSLYELFCIGNREVEGDEMVACYDLQRTQC